VPQEAEVLGLAALITYAHARRGARVRAGTFVPLHEQDSNFWNTTLIAEADRLLARAFACSKPGRFQIEAAIQQAHVKRGETGLTDWPAILLLSEGLCRLWPTRGADVSRAAALAEVHGPEAGLTALAAISGSMTAPFQAYEATQAHLLAKSGRHQEAAAAYERAIALTPELALRHWLEGQKAGLRHS
jgi:RNA polymerase sigma-70 factor, ECF subfamily